MKNARRILCVLIAAASSTAATAQTVDTLDPATRTRIDRIAATVLDQTGVPSASVAVVNGGKLVFTHAYGKARLDPSEAATPDMRYSIGSISKQFTAAAILLLQEQGKLSLDDAVGKYVPGLTRGDEVTIRQILSHTSGYQDYWPEDYVLTPMLKPITTRQILDTWAKKPLDFDPGTQWQYSSTNYVIAGLIVEKVSSQRLMDFLSEHLFHPLGMKSVWNSDEEKLTHTDATAYYRHALGPLRVAPKEGRGWFFAAAELAMTAHDLALWDESLLSQTVLSPESYKTMFTEVKLKDGKGTSYGLGVVVSGTEGHHRIFHDGEVSGFMAENDVYLDDGVAVVVLTNQDAVDAPQTIESMTADAVLGADSGNAAERQAKAIYRDLQQGRIDRTLLAPNLSDYFTQEALDDFRASLGPLGEPFSFRQTDDALRGGMTFRVFRIIHPNKRLELTTYTYPNGKLEQFQVEPAD
jgi:CubicO group peptidase (beta-lactamase class C family)